jgi:RpiB/LacA/LacB family sugar-phosphate isomerase
MNDLLVIPLAGHGRRFKSEGYVLPKQMLYIDEFTTLEHSLKSVNLNEYKTYFILRKDQKPLANFISEVCSPFDFQIVFIDRETRGSVETVLELEHLVNPESKMSIFTMDVTFNPTYNSNVFGDSADGGLLTFKSNSQNYSYAKSSIDGFVAETAEKIVISENALVGIYYFRKASFFFRFARQMIHDENVSAGEFYIAPLYNYLIASGLKIKGIPVDEFYVFGTPREFEFYKNQINVSLSKKTIGICADHSGYETKGKIQNILHELKIDYIDYGTYSHRDCDYNEVVNLAAEGLLAREVDFVIGSCRSGQGVSIASSAHKSVISAVIYDLYSAEFSIKHNCANFVSVPSAIWSDSNKLRELINILISTRFEGGRHQERLMKVFDVRNHA